MAEQSAAQIDHSAWELRHAFFEDRTHGKPREVLVPAKAERAQIGQAQIRPDRADHGQRPPLPRDTPCTAGAFESSSPTHHFTSPQRNTALAFGRLICFGIAFARSRPPVTKLVAASRRRRALPTWAVGLDATLRQR